MPSRRPNILWITTDQQRFDHLGIAGERAIETPHLDRLGREGVHHTRAYCPSPLCTPARVSWLTGTWPSRHGSYSIGTSFDHWGIPTLPEQLAAAGYRTGLVGKTHFVSRGDEAAHIIGAERADDPDAWRAFDGPYCGFEWVRCSGGHTNEGSPNMHYRSWLADQSVDPSPWFPSLRGERLPSHEKVGRWNIPAEYTDSAWVGGETTRFIEAAAADERPWLCMANFQDPHCPFACPEPWFSQVDTSKMRLPPGHQPGEFDDKPAFYRQLWAQRDGDWWQQGYGDWVDRDGARRIPVPCCFPDQELNARRKLALQATLGMVAHVDHQVGRLLSALERSGQLDHTLVIFTSDHGEMHGHHGLWGKGLPAYEDAQRVPLLVWGPELVAPRGDAAQLINTGDIPLSLCRLAGIEPAVGMQGCDCSAFWRGEVDRTQDATLIELRPTRTSVAQTTLVTDRHKLVMYRDGSDWECYDLIDDPDQARNLWRQPGQEALHRELLIATEQARMARDAVTAPRLRFA